VGYGLTSPTRCVNRKAGWYEYPIEFASDLAIYSPAPKLVGGPDCLGCMLEIEHNVNLPQDMTHDEPATTYEGTVPPGSSR
jgi:hypothetical protein